MATTSYTDFTAGCRAIGARTDSAGAAATDLASDEDRLINHILTEGYLTAGAFEVAADSPASMDVIVGSGTAKADLYVVEGDDTGQHPYIVRLDDATVTVTLDAADASNPRIDEVWLVVTDAAYDSGSTSLPRIGYRKGTAAASPSAPGADASWKAAVKLATITVGAGVSTIGSGDITDNRSAAAAAVPNLLGVSEVDGSTEVASASLTTSYAAVASVSLTIPSDWREWKCAVSATYVTTGSDDGDTYTAKIVIDGTSHQEQAAGSGGSGPPATTTTKRPGSIGARGTGITATGTRTIALHAKEISGTGSGVTMSDVYLYARAVRTA